MDESPPQPASDAYVSVEALCQATGMSVEDFDGLVMSGRMAGGYSDAHELVGFFADSLPTREQLTEWGYSVPSSYSPEALRPGEVSELPARDGRDNSNSSNVIRW